INRTSAHRSSTRRAPARRATPMAPVAPVAAPHPGLFARHYERAFYDGVQKINREDYAGALEAFKDADESDDKHRAISPTLCAGVLCFQLEDHAGALPYLERIVNSAQALPDKLMSKYARDMHISVDVNGIPIPVEVGSLAAAMLTAVCYSETGRLQE